MGKKRYVLVYNEIKEKDIITAFFYCVQGSKNFLGIIINDIQEIIINRFVM